MPGRRYIKDAIGTIKDFAKARKQDKTTISSLVGRLPSTLGAKNMKIAKKKITRLYKAGKIKQAVDYVQSQKDKVSKQTFGRTGVFDEPQHRRNEPSATRPVDISLSEHLKNFKNKRYTK